MRKEVLRQIEREISGLTPSELLEVVEIIIGKLKEYQTLDKLDLRELYGAGRNLWSEDAQRYVDSLRKGERIKN